LRIKGQKTCLTLQEHDDDDDDDKKCSGINKLTTRDVEEV